MRALFNFVARQNFAKKETRSPRGFLPRPLLRAGESEFRTPPPFPQKNEAGCGQEFRSKKVRANAKITPHSKGRRLAPLFLNVRGPIPTGAHLYRVALWCYLYVRTLTLFAGSR